MIVISLIVCVGLQSLCTKIHVFMRCQASRFVFLLSTPIPDRRASCVWVRPPCYFRRDHVHHSSSTGEKYCHVNHDESDADANRREQYDEKKWLANFMSHSSQIAKFVSGSLESTNTWSRTNGDMDQEGFTPSRALGASHLLSN